MEANQAGPTWGTVKTEPLGLAELARIFKVSRTTMREMLDALHAEPFGQRKWRVSLAEMPVSWLLAQGAIAPLRLSRVVSD